MKMKVIEVTWEDIAQGKKKKCGECPLALALSRAYGKNVEISYRSFNFEETPEEAYDIPEMIGTIVQSWIMRFDAGMPVEPFSFDLPENLLDMQMGPIEED